MIPKAVRSWFIVTPEYPPEVGGVADYTRQVAVGLAERNERVRVFTPSSNQIADPGVEVTSLGDRFLTRSGRTLDRALRESEHPPLVLLQYVPQGFGLKGLNLPFLGWLAARAPRLWVMFHEVVFPYVPGQAVARDVLATGTRLMLTAVASRAERCLVSTQGWAPYLEKWARLRCKPEWMPVPSNLPARPTKETASLQRGDVRLFHFGTYSPEVIEPLSHALPGFLRGHSERSLLLLGRNSERFRAEVVVRHPELAGQLAASGELPAQEVVEAMASCDAGVYPFPDGVSGRRSSLMGALQLGVPVLTTEGHLTEPLWRSSRAVGLAPAQSGPAFVELVDSALRDRAELARLGAAGQALYQRYFSCELCIDRLLAVE